MTAEKSSGLGPLSKDSFLRAGECVSYALSILLLSIFIVQLFREEARRHAGVEAFWLQKIEAAVQQRDGIQAPVFKAEPGASRGRADIAASEHPGRIAALQRQTIEAVTGLDNSDLVVADEPDTTLWAAGRIADYLASREAELPDVLAVLEIESVGLRVPVYATNTEQALDRGAGIIDGMAYPHEPGNVGISGHRDGYFRALKDIAVGDSIVLQTLTGTKRFRIQSTDIVDKSDVSALQDVYGQMVTLVTCYPFYYVGAAPQRFVVTARPDIEHYN